jgi:N6-L-threonylcarbamoyladenine synthase
MPDAIILGIESSCDETGAAVVRAGEQILSNVVASQIATHQPYGGVVPELASREHLRAILPVVRQSLAEAGHTYNSIDAIAVTQGPGLAGALLVGISFAKALSFALGKPLIAVNHLEGHVHAVLLEQRQSEDADLQFPVLALVVSGGHTHLYLAEVDKNLWTYAEIGHTRDDAAGEAFDKVAKLLALGYPGGPIIDRLAPHGDPQAVKFQIAQIKHRDRNEMWNKVRNKVKSEVRDEVGSEVRSEASRSAAALTSNEQNLRPRFDFSYSGIKTAVLRYVETEHLQQSIDQRRKALHDLANPTFDDYLRLCDRQTLNLVASFQRAIVTDLVTKTLAAAREYDIRTLFVSGGVAANQELRTTFQREAEMQGLPVFFPSRPLSTDNAAMIAAAAFPKFLRQDFAPADFSAEANFPLR